MTTTQEERNTAILKGAFDAWHQSKGTSTDHWLSIMADEVKLRSLAEGAKGLEFTTLRKGAGEIQQYLDGLLSQFEMIHYTVEHYTAQDDRVIAVGSTSWRNKTTGKVVDTAKADVTRFKDGKMIEFFEFYDTAMMLESCTPD